MPSNINHLLCELHETLDEIDALNARIKPLSEYAARLKAQILEWSKANGDIKKFTGGGLSVSIRDKVLFNASGDKWPVVHKWLVEQGYEYCIQRRLNDAKLLELYDGGVSLPAELEMSYLTIPYVTRVG